MRKLGSTIYDIRDLRSRNPVSLLYEINFYPRLDLNFDAFDFQFSNNCPHRVANPFKSNFEQNNQNLFFIAEYANLFYSK